MVRETGAQQTSTLSKTNTKGKKPWICRSAGLPHEALHTTPGEPHIPVTTSDGPRWGLAKPPVGDSTAETQEATPLHYLATISPAT
ncbi:Hypothetical predicted protein, partial [Pelobates cultripes]